MMEVVCHFVFGEALPIREGLIECTTEEERSKDLFKNLMEEVEGMATDILGLPLLRFIEENDPK